MRHLITAAALAVALTTAAQSSLRVNRIGYLSDDLKTAVYLGPVPSEYLEFELSSPEGLPGTIDSVVVMEPWLPVPYAARIYFSSTTQNGDYTLAAKHKPTGKIVDVARLYVGDDAYSRHGINELILNYLRQQRCGYNPVLNQTCHSHDGFVVLGDSLDGQHFDVSGGWHDASDYLQYLPTSANTVYQLLFAYASQPEAWGDSYDSSGRVGANGVADILDEARHGLEWLCKMNPRDSLYFNQIADDRDHRFLGLPSADTVDYGRGPGKDRPVYPVSGTPYGLMTNKNRSSGMASSVGKFASAFAAGAEVFKSLDPAFADSLAQRARTALTFAQAHPGASQTAPCASPYFYEEDNWSDDVELAAASLRHYDLAAEYGHMEPTTPWMGADSARHYQWYPFVNLGHALLASQTEHPGIANSFKTYMEAGVAAVAQRGLDNPFRVGVPFIWCSNNLVVAFATQAMLYREISGDESYREAETAARDWLFGLNPWSQCMIILPDSIGAPSPQQPHAALTDMVVNRRPGRDALIGGLVDGPVYSSIFGSLRGVSLRKPDEFAHVQGRAVYHDDFSDYSTNEPTLDGTASLAYLLGRLCRRE